METNSPSHVDLSGMCKYALCEEFADSICVPTDYVWMEFVDPNVASIEEVCFVLSRF